jgi:hypothetical protein
MLKQAALHFIGEPAIGTETSAEDASDLALDGALARALDGVEDPAQKAAPEGGGLAAGMLRQLAGGAEIPIERNAIHGWGPQTLLLKYSHLYNCWLRNLMLVFVQNKGYVLIQCFRLSHA